MMATFLVDQKKWLISAIQKRPVCQLYLVLLCDAWFQFLRWGSIPCMMAGVHYFHWQDNPLAWGICMLAFAKGLYPLDPWWHSIPSMFCVDVGLLIELHSVTFAEPHQSEPKHYLT